MLVGVGLLVWAWPQASVSELLARPPNAAGDALVPGYFFAGLTAMVGSGPRSR
jgi:NCS1 family nucleobase:cation symporter-1